MFGLMRLFKLPPTNTPVLCTGVLACAVLVALPMGALVLMAMDTSSADVWNHLLDTVLWGYVYRSLVLMLGVAIGCLVIGGIAGWLIANCQFTGRNVFRVLLVLPMAIPAYVMAFVATDQLEYAGIVQQTLRDIFGWQSKADYYFPDIRSVGGAILCMILVLYPYVYLMASAGFRGVSQKSWDSARAMGYTPCQIFWKIALPIARPSMMIGVAFVMMETLNDFGTVSYFAVNTLARGVYDVWIDMGSLAGASQISLIMMMFIVVLIVWERRLRATVGGYASTGKPMALLVLTGWHKGLAIGFCTVVCGVGFVIPVGILATYAVVYFDYNWTADFVGYMLNSITVAGLTAGIVLIGATVMAYGVRLNPSHEGVQKTVPLALMGYGVPGTILGIGVLVVLSQLDNAVDGVFEQVFGINTGLLLTGSIAGLVYAYGVRFMTLGYGAVHNALNTLSPNIEGAGRTLGHSPKAVFWRIHLPCIQSGLAVGAVLVFVDSMKELSITMVLKPLNFDTLATHVFAYASDGLLEQSALGAIGIVAVGLIPVAYLMRMIR